MLRPRRFEREIDPGRYRSGPKGALRRRHSLHWIPGPGRLQRVSFLNIVLPAAERWFVAT
jgi:hypothetical protein